MLTYAKELEKHGDWRCRAWFNLVFEYERFAEEKECWIDGMTSYDRKMSYWETECMSRENIVDEKYECAYDDLP